MKSIKGRMDFQRAPSTMQRDIYVDVTALMDGELMLHLQGALDRGASLYVDVTALMDGELMLHLQGALDRGASP
jgi:alkylhydroperoxidase/carboxymuconolactone decarboxylase family protein YurZ